MKFGVGDFSGQRPPDSEAAHDRLYAELLEQAELIEQAGLDSMWMSEHHFANDGYMPSVIPIAAALLARTKRIAVATDRLAVSLHDPIRLAEDAIALDLLSGGRFILGLSLCYRREEFAGFGVDPSSDEINLERAAAILRDAFSGRLVVVGARSAALAPLPSSPRGPRLMIAADGKQGAQRAARLADMMMVDPTEPWAALDGAVETFDRERGNGEGAVVLFTYGGLSDAGRDAAWHEVEAGFRYMRHTYDLWMGREPTQAIPPAHYRLLLGTPMQVAEQTLEYRHRFGERVHVVLRCNYPGMAADMVRRQIRLWGEAAGLAREMA